jgi:multicomponent Na+:H+ antiporter subunit D
MTSSLSSLPPGTILVVGALLLVLLRGRLQKAWLVALPLISAAHLLSLETGLQTQIELFGYQLTLIRIDKLSLVWGYIFHIAAFLCAIYALHVKDTLQHVSGLVYAGAAISAVFAGDLITLFIYWELTAISSVFLIWARRSERSFKAGMRYLLIQVGSGVILLAGIILRVASGGDLVFGKIISDSGSIQDLPTLLIFIAFGIKAAFPLLHNWLQDTYPEATATGTVFLSAFTTKLAIYALARGFAGTECLVWIGAIMTAFPVFFAVIENDLRRVLAYSLNNQLGYMVVGIGIGSELSLNGTASHAFAHILYKALLFMSMGAVLHRTGTTKCTELGGLYKSMPWTAAFCGVGAASISAFPLLSGFVSKGMIIAAAAHEHRTVIWLVLLFASAGVLHHSGIKIPFYSFFAHDSGKRVKEAPWNMLLAMGITAALCIFIGCIPGPLYSILPYSVDFNPYTAAHVITQLQLLLLATMAFAVLKRSGLYPAEMRCTNLDFDWTYRRAIPIAVSAAMRVGGVAQRSLLSMTEKALGSVYRGIYHLHGPEGVFARTWTTGAIAFWAVLGLGFYLLLYLF